MAIALHQLQQDICGVNVTGACPKMYPFNGTLFFVSLLPHHLKHIMGI